jgi:putative ABC transport system ATP-binding protein
MTPADSSTGAVMVDGLTKTYGEGETLVHAVDGISFVVDPGEFVVLLGPSGSGKTTTLNLLGAIEEPTAGRLEVGRHDISALDEAGRTQYRREEVGFVFQLYNLVPSLTAMENVQLIAEITGPDAEPRSLTALERVGIAERADHFPGQLSGGQQQLVAIARAIVKDPSLLLCDEPTGALDLDRGRVVLGVLADLAAEGRTVVCVTHNSTIATMATRVLRLSDGRIVDDVRQSDPVAAGDLVW